MEPEHVAERIDRTRYVARMHVLVTPSFEDPWSYELLAPVSYRSKPALAVKTVRHMGIDSIKFAASNYAAGGRQRPTIEEFAVQIDPVLIDDLYIKAAALRVPPFPDVRPPSMDGSRYELVFTTSPCAARFEWWDFPPPGWEPLQTLVNEIIAACG